METNLTPYEEGQLAAKEGKSIFDYPYKPNTKNYEEWMDGFMTFDKVAIFNQDV